MADQESYRDKISTVDSKGKRVWVYPKKPKGKFFNYRQVVAYLLLAFLFMAPHIKIDGQQMLLFDIIHRKFIFFGKVFWPQDFHLFALGMIGSVVFVTLFTVIYGRLFCGWVCPQTVFMEMVFRRIEYLIEGDWTKQKKLNKEPWTGKKVFKKVLKHLIFWGISFAIANTFLAYIIGSDQLWEIQIDDPRNHMGGLIAIAVFSTVFYGVFAFLREQVCTTICPYGRLQGVLLDPKSIVVAYDHVRGEGENGRAKFKKGEDRAEAGKGDCIDCGQCVHVCPTGIDIRNGTQLECVNCTACIDACDFMMESVGLEKGLIRFVSEEGIEKGTKFQWTKRNVSYSIALALIMGVLAFLIVTRSDFEATVTRARGVLFQNPDKNHISNIYDLNLVNKTSNEYDVSLQVEGHPEYEVRTPKIHLEPQSEITKQFVIVITKDEFNKFQRGKTKFKLKVLGNGEEIEEVSTTFIGPSL